jgi:dienelactone hydrolase/pimeloyl-ACP methyl ester carboxylesterase
MNDTVLPKPDPEAFPKFIQAQAQALRAKDEPPRNRKEWEARRKALRQAMFTAMGAFPANACPLEAQVLGTVPRQGYRIEKVIFQSRPDVWVSANAYIPEPAGGRVPAVLVVHGHWPWAKIDPVVQARCLGLVKLGFIVLAVDAFGAGERYTEPARGTYHGALYGSTLWPVGQTLLGIQVYDNRRAVDYLRSRPEVDGDRLGITGASGGGNQSMYAGALDERLRAVVPVCSVGTYQAYLRAACCVCEVLPGALRFAEEGDVLALVAPRALLVVNASRDAYQFSVEEAKKSLARARPVFQLMGDGEKLQHAVFESGHDYSRPMREVMYGWMTRWLKNEGEGKPIDEPTLEAEKPEDLRCWPQNVRPKGFLFPPSYAGRQARELLTKYTANRPDHVQGWESTAVHVRAELRKLLLSTAPKPTPPVAKLGKVETIAGLVTTPTLLEPEPGLPLPVILRGKSAAGGRQAVCILLDLSGKSEALAHPLAKGLLAAGWLLAAPDLRATGETRPATGKLRETPDHNLAEHALWIGRPLLGQWLVDVQCLLDWLALQPGIDSRRTTVAGIGQAGIIVLCAAALFEERSLNAITVGMPTSYVTDEAYGPGTYMGLLVPGILRWADLPQLGAMVAPRRLIVADGVSPQGTKQTEKQLREAYSFTTDIYRLYKEEAKLSITEGRRLGDLIADL